MPNTLLPSTACKRTPKAKTPALSRIEQELAAMEAYIKEITRSKEAATRFLTRAGIIDSKGRLAKPYRP